MKPFVVFDKDNKDSIVIAREKVEDGDFYEYILVDPVTRQMSKICSYDLIKNFKFRCIY